MDRVHRCVGTGRHRHLGYGVPGAGSHHEPITGAVMTDTTTSTPANVADVEEALRDVVDPELGINVVDLGLIYGITVDGQSHAVIDVIEDQTAQALEGLVASHRINWVWMPPWGPDKITDDGREQLRALGFNL